jgi:hypothetical protein
MPLTFWRRPSLLSMLAAPFVALAALAAGSLVVALPVDLAWGAGGAGASHPAAVKVVNAEIMVLFATQVDGHGSIDPAIGNMPQLKKPPLSAYNTYHLLDKRSLAIQMGSSSTYTLANGRVLQVSFVEPTAEQGFHVKAAINQPGGNAYLKLLELTAKANEPFFVGGQSFNGGSILLAITLRP